MSCRPLRRNGLLRSRNSQDQETGGLLRPRLEGTAFFFALRETFGVLGISPGKTSGADGRAQGVGQGLAEAFDVGVVFGFDHDAGQLLCSGIAEDHAAVFS